jgi:3',5'-cyclic-AMP phosphodiesterase
MIVIAHLSDTHLDLGDHAAERATRVLTYLHGLPRPVDVVLVTGDIADHGLPEEYEQARKILDSPLPLFTCPGNHDVRRAYREALLMTSGSDGPVNAVHHAAGALFAMCDSSIPGRNDGLLDDESLDWLDGVLAGSGDAPAFVCFHHPPVELHSGLLDPIRQHGEERLAAVVERHPQVVALLCGHAHTPAASTFAGRPLLVAPGVVSTLRLPWEGADALDKRLPPALAFHILGDDGRLTTHYRVLP